MPASFWIPGEGRYLHLSTVKLAQAACSRNSARLGGKLFVYTSRLFEVGGFHVLVKHMSIRVWRGFLQTNADKT